MPKVPEPWKLARAFCRVLNEWLTKDQLDEINTLNSHETNPAICHSGSYCDSNQAMIDALETLGMEWDTDNIALCNAAWDLAKAAGFNPSRVRIEMDGLKQYDSVVSFADGSATQNYRDWFAHDKAAEEGYELLMAMQGYKVTSVVIGFPCVVTIE